MKPGTPEALRKGAALYGKGRFWEAHEAWEEAWLVEEDEVRVLLQGLIQVAAGCFKAAAQKQPRGCVKLFESGLDKLRPLPADLCGVRLGEFVAATERALVEARRWLAGELADLPFSILPKLHLD
jgi:predicted metal-dependent hydrolase